MKPERGDLFRSFLRSFGLQGSWNYASYQGGGLVYALLPLLSRIHAGDPVRLSASLERHLAYFNGHPYLAPLAVGALARAEQEGTSPAETDRFRRALSSALGALGDRLVWAGWRPFCLLCGVVAFGMGSGPLEACMIFLLPYNAGHLALRVWAFRKGWREGLGVAGSLPHRTLQRLSRYLAAASAVLAGAAVVLLGGRLPPGAASSWLPWLAAAGAVGAGAGFALPERTARVPALLLAGALLARFLLAA